MVTDYGAVLSSDEKHALTNAKAIAAAVAACAGKGEAVVIPAGKLVTARFNLSSNTVLSVDGMLIGTSQKALAPLLPPFPSYGKSRSGYPLRYAPLIGSAKERRRGCTCDAGWTWRWCRPGVIVEAFRRGPSSAPGRTCSSASGGWAS